MESPKPMRGKTVLITGANSGIGKATAVGLAEQGASLVLVCRNRGKAQEAMKEVSAATGNPSMELIVADLLVRKEVRRAAEEFLQGHKKLDVLVNNAGSDFISYEETEDGIERTMALNYFAPFLLTNLLLPVLERSAPSRVVNVASSAHFSGKVDVENIGKDRRMGVGGLGAYSRSKLALVLFTYELARREKGKGVTVNCLHPGVVRTNLWSHAGAFSPLLRLASLAMISPKKGADTPVYLASSPDVAGATGKYFDKRKEKRSAQASYDDGTRAKLWEVSARITGLPSSAVAV